MQETELVVLFFHWQTKFQFEFCGKMNASARDFFGFLLFEVAPVK